MELGHIFEAAMLICFGFSWPINVIKAYKARSAKGTSLAFILLIITGYVAGISAKFINGQINYVLAVYFLNLVIVMANVFVYFRNVSIDKKNQKSETIKKIYEIHKNYNINNEKYLQEENMNYQELNEIAKMDGVVLMGGSFDLQIPVTELAHSFDFNFELYNRSEKNLSVKNAKEFFQTSVAPICPEAMIVHLGNEDVNFFKTNSSDFDNKYLELIHAIKSTNKKIRIALVSVKNAEKNETIKKMNSHIKAIADAEKCVFVNLDNAKLWNPNATKASVDFAYKMGLRVRKPLADVCEILYSYACLEIEEIVNEVIAG